VLWISHKAELGGAELALVEAVKALAQRGHEAHVVLPTDGPLTERLDTSAEVHVCPHNPWAGRPVSTSVLARWAAHALTTSVPDLTRLARLVRPDLIASNTITVAVGGFAAQRAHIPHVWFVHELGVSQHDIRFFLGRRATFFLMKQTSDLTLVSSQTLKQYCATWLSSERIRVAYSAVEVPEISESRTVGSGKSFRLILVGEKAPGKRQRDAVNAVGRLVSGGIDVRLDLVGGGTEEYDRFLRSQIRSLDLEDTVRLVGFCRDPFTLVADSDAALTCSLDEGFGRVAVEAMKLGKPVIGAASGATPELVHHGWNGLVYRPRDVHDLARCIEKLYRDRDGAREMGRHGRSWANEHFNLDVYGDQLEAALEAAANAGSNR